MAALASTGAKKISFQRLQGFNGINEFEPAGWQVELDDTSKSDEPTGEKEQPTIWPMGVGTALMNGCFGSGYKKGDPCYSAAKSNLSKSQTKCGEKFVKLGKSKDGGPRKRQERCADDAFASLDVVREKLKIMRSSGEAVVSEIDDMGANLKGEKPDEIIKTINLEIESYKAKYDEFFAKNDEIIQEAEAIVSGQDQVTAQVQVAAPEKSSWRAFKPQAALKPPFLEKESFHLEVSHFCTLFRAYVMDGYNGVPEDNPTNMHLMPLVEATWYMSLVQIGDPG